jgi:uncharacterized protein
MTPVDEHAEPTLHDQLRDALKAAMKQRDEVATTALRAALAAIDNAGAVAVGAEVHTASGPVAGAASGLGATEVPRRQLDEDEARRLVGEQRLERHDAADSYDRLGQHDRAARLRHEAAVLDPFAAQ